MKRTAVRITIAALLALCCSSCGAGLVISMDENIPPNFRYKGNRWAECCTNLDFFVVNEEVGMDGPESERWKSLWWVWPKEGENGKYYNLPTFTYGRVPEGWRQTVPEQGEPPPLEEGKTYEAGGNFMSGQTANLRFTIRNGKAVWLRY